VLSPSKISGLLYFGVLREYVVVLFGVTSEGIGCGCMFVSFKFSTSFINWLMIVSYGFDIELKLKKRKKKFKKFYNVIIREVRIIARFLKW
jgi:hypothetical protein